MSSCRCPVDMFTTCGAVGVWLTCLPHVELSVSGWRVYHTWSGRCLIDVFTTRGAVGVWLTCLPHVERSVSG